MKQRIGNEDGAIKNFLKENALQLTMQIFAVAIVALNLFIVNKLAPLTESINALNSRVLATEKTLDERTDIVIRFIQLEQRDALLVEDVEQMKSDIRQILIIHGGEVRR